VKFNLNEDFEDFQEEK